jgi:hypothetical protein
LEEKMKKKKSRKNGIVILTVLFIMAGAGVYYLGSTQVHAVDEKQEFVLEEGQEYIYAKITSVLGNEIAYTVLDAQIVDSSDLDGKSSRGKRQNATKVLAEVEIKNMPDMSQVLVEDKAERTERPITQQRLVKDEADDAQSSMVTIYTETDTTGQIQIPVGTEVETKLGTITTFSRLSNGDIIKMLLQKNDAGNKALMKIWIVE